MAVIKDLPGLKVTIKVDGKDLQEYDDPYIEILDDDDELELLVTATKETDPVSLNVRHIPHVVKYIEATPGKEFVFSLVKEKDFDSGCNHMAVGCEGDGKRYSLIHAPLNQRRGEWHCLLDGTQYGPVGNKRRRPFLFSDLKPVSSEDGDEDTLNRSMAQSKDLGTLRVLWFKMKHCRSLRPFASPPIAPDDSVHEKALKGRALYTKAGLGRETATRYEDPDYEDNFQDPQKQPCAVFEFRYRTREGLIEERIIPRPTPIDGMTDEQVRAYALKLHREREDSVKKEETPVKVKIEGSGGPSLKREAPDNELLLLPKRYKETRRGDGKTEIDLSD
ncbi:hypothetical protein GGR57DRAFT_326972 [Xylariaceae sp. FL1272]|nr:hypothetical protein GGR57DRAFT_326972 [Xylariaceae sp. FL1272]